MVEIETTYIDLMNEKVNVHKVCHTHQVFTILTLAPSIRDIEAIIENMGNKSREI